MFCPELIASLSFTPVAAGVIFISLMVIETLFLHILREDNLLITLKKCILRGRKRYKPEQKIPH
jgi:hypothetical protein